MNTTLKKIKPETIALLEENAERFGLSVDDYLCSILLSNEKDMSLKSDNEVEFEADMQSFAEDTDNSSSYDGTYSREDIYFDHD